MQRTGSKDIYTCCMQTVHGHGIYTIIIVAQLFTFTIQILNVHGKALHVREVTRYLL